MLPKRITRTDEHSAFTNSERHLILAAEALRASDSAPKDRKDEKGGGDEKVSLFWRIFGGTILSITALMIINAYQSLANNIHEVRNDISRFRESAGEFIKKDEFNNRTTTIWNGIREAQAVNASVTVLSSKLTALEDGRKVGEQDHKDLVAVGAALAALRERDGVLEKQIKDAEAERRELTRELQHLRERLAKLEGLQEAKPTVKPAVATEKKSDGGQP